MCLVQKHANFKWIASKHFTQKMTYNKVETLGYIKNFLLYLFVSLHECSFKKHPYCNVVKLTFKYHFNEIWNTHSTPRAPEESSLGYWIYHICTNWKKLMCVRASRITTHIIHTENNFQANLSKWRELSHYIQNNNLLICIPSFQLMRKKYPHVTISKNSRGKDG